MDQNYKISILDNSGVETTLDFDFRHEETLVNFGKVVEELKYIIESKIKILSKLIPYSEKKHFIFNLEQYSDSALAAFFPDISNGNELRFTIYYPSIIDIVKGQFGARVSLLEFENTIIHELIHSLDMNELKKTVEIVRSLSNKAHLNRHYYLSEGSDKEFNLLTELVVSFSRFRDEGLAILGEKLLGTGVSREKDEVINSFKFYFNNILELVSEMQNATELEITSLHELVKQLNNTAYNYAEVLFLLVISVIKKDVNVDRYYNALINEEKKELIDFNERLEFIKIASQIDTSQFILGLLMLRDKKEPVIEYHTFLHLCGLIQNDEDNINIQVFINGIISAEKENNPDAYLNAIKNIMGYPMDIEELTELFKEFKCKDINDNIIYDLIHMGEQLFEIFKKSNSEIAQWALTYFLDDQDLIYDDIPFLAYQDDWIVMNSALNIINDEVVSNLSSTEELCM